MSENQNTTQPVGDVEPAVVAAQPAPATNNGSELAGKAPMPLVVYVLMAIGLFVPFVPFLGVIIAHVYKSNETDPVALSHFSYQIRTYWWGLLWFLLGAILSLVLIGYLVLLGWFVWTVYRLVKGFSALGNNQVIR